VTFAGPVPKLVSFDAPGLERSHFGDVIFRGGAVTIGTSVVIEGDMTIETQVDVANDLSVYGQPLLVGNSSAVDVGGQATLYGGFPNPDPALNQLWSCDTETVFDNDGVLINNTKIDNTLRLGPGRSLDLNGYSLEVDSYLQLVLADGQGLLMDVASSSFRANFSASFTSSAGQQLDPRFTAGSMNLSGAITASGPALSPGLRHATPQHPRRLGHAQRA
jgi:hypothetical protein